MKKTKIGIGILLAVLLALPVSVGATTTTTTTTGSSSMTVTIGTTNNANAGDTVTVRLVGSNNPGITTLGLQLGYDEDYLSYTGAATWSDTISSNGIQMVSAATQDNKPVVNISAVFNTTYTSNENMVTLSFTVKRAYSDMSAYLTPTVREVTDANQKDVTVNWVYDPNAGLTDSSQNLVPDDSTTSGTTDSSGTTGGTTGSTGTTDGTTDSTGTTDGSGTTGSTTDSSGTTGSTGTTAGTSKGSTTNNYYGGSSSSTIKKSVDNTPTTGALNLPLVFSVIIVTFVAIAGVCLRVLKKKRA